MRPSHAQTNGPFRYYVSRDLVERSVDDGADGWRIPAGEIESAVAHALATRLRDPDFRSKILRGHQGGTDASDMILGRNTEVAERLGQPGSACWHGLLRSMIKRVELTKTELRVEASFATPTKITDADLTDLTLTHLPPFTLTVPIELQRRGAELRLVLQGAAAREPRPDALLLWTLIEGRARAADYLDPKQRLTVSDVARRHGADVGDVYRSLQLAFLAPDLVACILDGSQPLALTAERLKRVGELPLLWNEKRALLACALAALTLESKSNFSTDWEFHQQERWQSTGARIWFGGHQSTTGCTCGKWPAFVLRHQTNRPNDVRTGGNPL